MGAPIDALYASDGVAPAVRATISSDRLPGDMDVITDSVANWPHKGIATSGTPDEDGNIIPDTVCVFEYVLSGTIIHITGFAPGYYDVGHSENQICILKPTTHHTDSLIDAILNTSNLPDGGTTGQTLVKASNADGDAVWAAPPGNSSWVFNVTPAGLINGTNPTFTLPDSASAAIVVLNGLVLKPGVGNDYDLTGATLTMSVPPPTGSSLTLSYTASTSAAITGSDSWVSEETPSGTINGVNKTFTVQQPYIGGTLQVYRNGIREKKPTHVVETSPSGATFTFDEAPLTGDDLMVSYQFAKAVAANADTVDNIHASAAGLPNTLLPLNASGRFPNTVLGRQSGATSAAVIAASSERTVAITFATPYATPPKVFVSVNHKNGFGSNGWISFCIATASGITTTGFTMYIKNMSTSATQDGIFGVWEATDN